LPLQNQLAIIENSIVGESANLNGGFSRKKYFSKYVIFPAGFARLGFSIRILLFG
jgi:hypothetical protein